MSKSNAKTSQAGQGFITLVVSLYHYKAKHPNSFESRGVTSLQQIHILQKKLNVSTQIC